MKKFLLSFFVLINFSLLANDATATLHVEKVVLGSGCFWGAEKGYEALPGVMNAVSGYADGESVRPSYREITKFKNKFKSSTCSTTSIFRITSNFKSFLKVSGVQQVYLIFRPFFLREVMLLLYFFLKHLFQ